MEFTKEELEEFKKIYLEEYGEMLSDGEALEIAQRLLGFLMLIYRPLPDGNEPEQSPDIEF